MIFAVDSFGGIISYLITLSLLFKKTVLFIELNFFVILLIFLNKSGKESLKDSSNHWTL